MLLLYKIKYYYQVAAKQYILTLANESCSHFLIDVHKYDIVNRITLFYETKENY